jgi:hypothetical protein
VRGEQLHRELMQLCDELTRGLGLSQSARRRHPGEKNCIRTSCEVIKCRRLKNRIGLRS